MTTHIRPEAHTLDWQRPIFDKRSLLFKIADRAPSFSVKPPRNRQWTRQSFLDQGTEGACTGFGLAHTLATTPRSTGMTDEMGRWFYHEAQKRDEWEGEDYDGSSVLGAMKAGKDSGWVSAYWWATTLEEIVSAVSHYGAMEWGTDWHSGMWSPNADGFVRVTGQVVGGHAYSVAGVNVVERWFRLDNSWGKDWGVRGSARITFADVEKLIAQRGEFALPRKVRR